MRKPLTEVTIIAIVSRMSSSTKFIIDGGDENNVDDADDEQLLITGGEYVDVFTTIFIERLTT